MCSCHYDNFLKRYSSFRSLSPSAHPKWSYGSLERLLIKCSNKTLLCSRAYSAAANYEVSEFSEADASLHVRRGTHQTARPRIEVSSWSPPQDDAKAWTSLIHSCKNPAQLQRCMNGLQTWNKYHLTAAFSRLASFCRGPDSYHARVASSRVLPALITRAKENLPRLQARSLATVAHCVGAYEYKDKELMAELAKISEQEFANFQPQGLSNLIWSFARLEVQPSQRWMDAFLQACVSSLGTFKPQELSIVMWSLAKLKFRLTSGKILDFLSLVQARLPSYCSHSISNVLWSLSTSEHRPEDTWLHAVAYEMAKPKKLATFTPQGLSQSLWALATFKYQPSQEFKQLVAARVSHILLSCNSIDLATLAYAYAALRMPPDEQLFLRLQKASLKQMHELLPSHLAKTTWAFAKLGLVPSDAWLRNLLSCSFQLMDIFNARDLSMFGWGLAKLGVVLPESFAQRYVGRIEAVAGEFPPQEVANTLWALACFNIRPSSVLVAHFFDATDQRLSSFKVSELSHMLWALADRRCVLDAQWINEYLKVSFLRMAEFSPQGLANMIWALERLHIMPPPAWLYSYVNACRTLLISGRLRALDLGSMVKALSSLDAENKLQKVGDFVLDAKDALSTAELGSQAYTQQQLHYLSGMRSMQRDTSSAVQASDAKSANAHEPLAQEVGIKSDDISPSELSSITLEDDFQSIKETLLQSFLVTRSGSASPTSCMAPVVAATLCISPTTVPMPASSSSSSGTSAEYVSASSLHCKSHIVNVEGDQLARSKRRKQRWLSSRRQPLGLGGSLIVQMPSDAVMHISDLDLDVALSPKDLRVVQEV